MEYLLVQSTKHKVVIRGGKSCLRCGVKYFLAQMSHDESGLASGQLPPPLPGPLVITHMAHSVSLTPHIRRQLFEGLEKMFTQP